MEIINKFEEMIAKYCGSKYGVAVDSCTNAIFLSLLYLKSIGELCDGDEVVVPCRTYCSVPMAVIHAGLKVKFKDLHWSSYYRLDPSRVYDAALRFEPKMYVDGSFYCISFQYRKALPIGRGGMICTDDADAVRWLQQARHNGKTPRVDPYDEKYTIAGWDMYMTEEEAQRGIDLFKGLAKKDSYLDYPDLSKQMNDILK